MLLKLQILRTFSLIYHLLSSWAFSSLVLVGCWTSTYRVSWGQWAALSLMRAAWGYDSGLSSLKSKLIQWLSGKQRNILLTIHIPTKSLQFMPFCAPLTTPYRWHCTTIQNTPSGKSQAENNFDSCWATKEEQSDQQGSCFLIQKAFE